MVHMFKWIYIHNYKCLVNFDLSLQKTVLLLGAMVPARRPCSM